MAFSCSFADNLATNGSLLYVAKHFTMLEAGGYRINR